MMFSDTFAELASLLACARHLKVLDLSIGFYRTRVHLKFRNLQSLYIYVHFPYSRIIGLMQYIGGNLRNLKINVGFSKAEDFE
ncbi:hypothetical protein BT96DRAFT_431835 [Gymnopus androsaceus JB14]|uniref:Uncharacterized protein n=1 Tax=Gymnopus androsaceus JB14 TaxID=1447944 RepID=A0A6A4GS49_9AGAR|nr:hypothetical protein BT96DRAFT_431835 [Gymnopus androsaceus JB14]